MPEPKPEAQQPVDQASPAEDPEPAKKPEPATNSAPLNRDDPASVWDRVRRDSRVGMGVRALLSDLELVSVSDGIATIRPTATVRMPAEKKLHELGALVSAVLGERMVAKLTAPDPSELPATADAPPEVLPPDQNHPMVVAAKRVFGAEIADARRKPKAAPEAE